MTVITPILTEHAVTQRLYIEVIFTKFHPNRPRNTGRTNRISLKPVSQVWSGCHFIDFFLIYIEPQQTFCVNILRNKSL
jgi:hypothetical protein